MKKTIKSIKTLSLHVLCFNKYNNVYTTPSHLMGPNCTKPYGRVGC